MGGKIAGRQIKKGDLLRPFYSNAPFELLLKLISSFLHRLFFRGFRCMPHHPLSKFKARTEARFSFVLFLFFSFKKGKRPSRTGTYPKFFSRPSSLSVLLYLPLRFECQSLFGRRKDFLSLLRLAGDSHPGRGGRGTKVKIAGKYSSFLHLLIPLVLGALENSLLLLLPPCKKALDGQGEISVVRKKPESGFLKAWKKSFFGLPICALHQFFFLGRK